MKVFPYLAIGLCLVGCSGGGYDKAPVSTPWPALLELNEYVYGMDATSDETTVLSDYAITNFKEKFEKFNSDAVPSGYSSKFQAEITELKAAGPALLEAHAAKNHAEVKQKLSRISHITSVMTGGI